MSLLKSKLARKILVAGCALAVVIAGIAVFDKKTSIIDEANRLAGEVAGITLSGKFFNYAIPRTLPANAQVASPYQDVQGDVLISGNVGIGTITPEVALDIRRTGNVSMSVQSNAGTNGNAVYSLSGRSSTAGASTWGIIANGGNSSYGPFGSLTFRESDVGNNIMTLTDNGNVGIGTENPNQGKVEVKGGTVCVDTNSDDNASSCIASESDIRLKKNIAPIQGALEKLLSVRGVEFDWKLDDPEVTRSYPLISRFSSSPHSLGVIAQEVQKTFPEAIMPETVGDNNYLQVDYTRLVAPIIEAIREQQKQIASLFNFIDIETKKLIVGGVDILQEIAFLKAENAALRSKVDSLESRLKALEQKVE